MSGCWRARVVQNGSDRSKCRRTGHIVGMVLNGFVRFLSMALEWNFGKALNTQRAYLRRNVESRTERELSVLAVVFVQIEFRQFFDHRDSKTLAACCCR